MIRIERIWLATEPLDMRAGTETALARVVQVFGAAQPHCAYLFTNKRANRMKVLVHDGFGIWLAARRLNRGRFVWSGNWQGQQLELSPCSTGSFPNRSNNRIWFLSSLLHFERLQND